MTKCNECGEKTSMPYECNLCSDQFCSDHRLPENHDCKMLNRGGMDPQMALEIENQKNKSGRIDRIKSRASGVAPDALDDSINGNVNLIFGIAILAVYLVQLTLITLGLENIHDQLFLLESENISHVWTWVTSVFAHSPYTPIHIIGNGIILVFFGTMVERIIGSRDYAILFLLAGILAGLGQVGLGMFLVEETVSVLGASGALLAVLGVLTIYNPKMTVHLYFFLPVPLWIITGGYAVISMVGVLAGGSAGGIAHGAHLIGLLIGVAYGYKTKDQHSIRDGTKPISELRRMR